MNFFKAASLAVFSVSLAAPAVAQEATAAKERTGVPTPGANQAARSQQQGKQQGQQQMYRGSNIIGANVRDTKDKKIGEIKDLMLDSARGEIAYAVVSFGGVTGTGRKYHAIPWQTLQPGDGGKYYVLNADSETISQAPGFDRNSWPDVADQKWSADVDRYWTRMVGRGLPDNSVSSGSPGAGTAQSSGARPQAPAQEGAR